MVFDEIDTGIGGKVAERVGACLRGLSATAQVVCVTHLPQVAAFADAHLLVVKQSGKGSVATGVQALSKQDRIKELARMISGAEVTEEAQAHARELIEGAATPRSTWLIRLAVTPTFWENSFNVMPRCFLSSLIFRPIEFMSMV